MKKPPQGPSLYYASDKNIFDALNQAKVDNETIQSLFERRNIVASKKTQREELAKYFSRLTHDYLDHSDISARLGIASRRERITSIDLIAAMENEQISNAIESLSQSLKQDGDAIEVSKKGNTWTVNIKYSEIDYKRAEFNQLQHRDGQIELIKNGENYVVRSTKSEYIDEARDELVRRLEKEISNPIERSVVSLFHIPNAGTRSKFFYDLMSDLPGYVRKDVTDVYVYKAKVSTILDDDDSPDDAAAGDSHVERVLMRGNGVIQSKLLSDLLNESKYHISKVGWIATETLGKGYGFHIEALFQDPKDCTGFSYLLRGVYPLEDNGKLTANRRTPTHDEVDVISKAIEGKARDLMTKINASYSSQKS